MAGLTALCLAARFVRWQFLLRRLGIRLPARPSLRIYLASLVGIATPAYAGELLRPVLVRRRFGVPVRITTTVLVLERLLDAGALAAIGLAASAGRPAVAAVMGLALAAVYPLWRLAAATAVRLGVPPGAVARLDRPRPLLFGFAASLLAWLPPALLVAAVAAGQGLDLAPAASLRVFATATLFGALTLMPAGVAATGSVAISELLALGLPLAESVAVVSAVRLATAGLTVAAGALFLVRELRAPRAAAGDAGRHFHEVAPRYLDQFAGHVWDHLLERKVALLAANLAAAPAGPGADLGCGVGLQAAALRDRGLPVVGLDLAAAMARRAAAAGVPALRADARALPFAGGGLAFAYAVGSLHHLPDEEAQARAVAEAARVLAPGGLLVVHETNPKNPVFRFYMGYLFPILRGIDEGTERWIPPERWRQAAGFELVRVEHFTFIPDFVPRPLLPLARAVERRLEASRLRTHSVHYLAVLRRVER